MSRGALGASGVGRGLGVVAGAALGAALGVAFVASPGLAAPTALDPAVWRVIEPGREERLPDARGRGARRVSGTIVLSPHLDGRVDTILPIDPRSFDRVTLALAASSAPLDLRVRADGVMHFVRVAPDTWAPDGQSPRAYTAPLVLDVVDGALRVGDTLLATGHAFGVELASGGGVARIASIEVEAAGETIVRDGGAVTGTVAAGAVGAALGALVGVAGLAPALMLSVPLALTAVSDGAWMLLAERAYLASVAPHALARGALAASFLPWLTALAAASGRALPTPTRAARVHGSAIAAWGVAATVAAAVGARGAWSDAVIGACFLLLPLAFAGAARLDPLGLLARDAPSFVAIALVGVGPGAALAWAWRLALLVGGAANVVERAPSAAGNALAVWVLLLLPVAELAARAGPLDEAWDAARVTDAAWDTASVFWEGTCGPAEARRAVVFVGGSSTGGAYQFRGEPTAFFPAQAHAGLCATGRAVRTVNLGESGRDTFTIARTAATALAEHRPAAVVAYVGVNDVYTLLGPATRAELAARETSGGLLGALTAPSRVLTGLRLLARPSAQGHAVSAVPLADAEANLRALAAACAQRGTRLLLALEHTSAQQAAGLTAYGHMLSRLAAELPHVEHFDVARVFEGMDEAEALVDRNHLSRSGNARLGAALVEPLAAAVDGAP